METDLEFELRRMREEWLAAEEAHSTPAGKAHSELFVLHASNVRQLGLESDAGSS